MSENVLAMSFSEWSSSLEQSCRYYYYSTRNSAPPRPTRPLWERTWGLPTTISWYHLVEPTWIVVVQLFDDVASNAPETCYERVVSNLVARQQWRVGARLDLASILPTPTFWPRAGVLDPPGC